MNIQSFLFVIPVLIGDPEIIILTSFARIVNSKPNDDLSSFVILKATAKRISIVNPHSYQYLEDPG